MNQVKRIRFVGQWLSFVVVVGALGIFAFIGLPLLAELSPVKERMELNEAKQIDGGATFYTDQPFLEKLLAQNEMNSNTKETSKHEW